MNRIDRRSFMQGAAALAGGSLFGGVARAAECDGTRDLHLVNGRFLTMDAQDSVVSSVAIRDGRIVALGHAGGLGPCARTINLKGATVIPGLIDTHLHFLRCGQNPGHEARIIEAASSIAELKQMIAARIRQLAVPAGEFITCIGGWNINGLAEKRLPTAAELDAAAPNHAVYLSTTGAGGAVTNTLGRQFFVSRGVTVTDSNGTFTLSAGQGLAALQAAQSEDDRQRGTAEVADFAASLGLTMVTDMGLQGAAVDFVDGYRYVLNLWREDDLNVRLRSFLNSSFDTGFGVAQAVVANSFKRAGVVRLHHPRSCYRRRR